MDLPRTGYVCRCPWIDAFGRCFNQRRAQFQGFTGVPNKSGGTVSPYMDGKGVESTIFLQELRLCGIKDSPDELIYMGY